MTESVSPVNIGPRGRRRRLLVAIAMALVVAGGLVLVKTYQPPIAWRLLLFVPLLVGSLGLFQAAAST